MKIYISCPECIEELEFEANEILGDSVWSKTHLKIVLVNQPCNCKLKGIIGYLKDEVEQEINLINEKIYETYDYNELFS